MKRPPFLIIVLVAAGCLPYRSAPAPAETTPPVFAGAPIIRPGMQQADADRVIGGSKAGVSSGGGFSLMMWSYPDGLQLDTNGDKVVRCACSGYSIHGSPTTPPPLTDAILEVRLSKGMSPSEVTVVAGPPRYGVETEAGTTDLYYPQPGIAVEYASGVLMRWRRVVTYDDKPPPE